MRTTKDNSQADTLISNGKIQIGEGSPISPVSPNKPKGLEKPRTPLSFQVKLSENQNTESLSQYTDLFQGEGLGRNTWKDNKEEDGEDSVSISDDEEIEEKNSFQKQWPENQNDDSPSNGEKILERWQALYAQKDRYEQKKEQLRKEYNTQGVDPECTFKPKLLTTNSQSTKNNTSLPIHQRNKLWLEKQQAKLKKSVQEEQERSLASCTFQPQVAKTMTKKVKNVEKQQSVTESRALDDYVKRQAAARQTKEEKEAILANPMTRFSNQGIKKETKIATARSPKVTNTEKTSDSPSFKKSAEANSVTSARIQAPVTPRTKTAANKESPAKSEQLKSEATLPEDPIYVSDVTYADAIKRLREELFKIPINID